jgi:hypothetical protein
LKLSSSRNLKAKKKMHLRDPEDTLPQALGRRWPQKVVMEWERIQLGHPGKFKQWGAGAVKGAVVSFPTLCVSSIT